VAARRLSTATPSPADAADEVERKFAPTPRTLALLASLGTPRATTFVDRYFDTLDHLLTTRDMWLRRRDAQVGGVVWDEAKILEYFPRLRERLDTPADYLSGGEQQMVAVARALSGNVKLLLLDEPFEGLAPAVVQDLFTVFDRLRSEVSIIIVEHNLDLVLALADRVFALERGAVFHQGPAEPLLTDLEHRKRILWL
jgi:ABC-type branched-subunit amino acid transport system ATPase component